ncbi:MAG: type VI secretion system tube protein TssD [Fimbriimonadaceae bacterium]
MTTLLAIVALVVATTPAHAAFEAYMLVKTQRQGMFKGAGMSRSNRIPIISIRYSLNSSGAVVSRGAATGRRQHGAVTFTLSESNSREFRTALATHEVLTDVKIEFVRPKSVGKVEQYQTIDLQQSLVTSIANKRAGGPANHEEVEVQLTYAKIQVTHTAGKVVSQDDWTK